MKREFRFGLVSLLLIPMLAPMCAADSVYLIANGGNVDASIAAS